MKTIIFIPVLLSGLLVALAPFFAASENAHCAEKDSGPSDKKSPKGMQKFYYDLLSDCGFSLSSDRAFIRDKKYAVFYIEIKQAAHSSMKRYHPVKSI